MRVVILFLLFLVAFSAFASNATRSIELQIMDGVKPVAGQRVVVSSPPESEVLGPTVEAITDSNGFVTLEVRPGTVTVVVPALSAGVRMLSPLPKRTFCRDGSFHRGCGVEPRQPPFRQHGCCQ